MHKVRIQKRKGRSGYYVYWRECGREHCKALPDRKLAEHYRAVKYQQLNSDVFLSTVDVPFDDMRGEYLQTFATRRLAANSLTEARCTLGHFERLCGPVSSRRWTQRVVDQFVRLRGSESNGQGERLSAWTVNKDISNLRAFVRWCQDIRRRYVDKEILLEKVRADRNQPKPLTGSQVRDLLISAGQRSMCWYMRVLMMLVTGLRKGDVEALRIADVDVSRCCIDTASRKTAKRMLYRPLHPAVMPALVAYMAELPDGQQRLFEQDSNTHKKWKPIRERAGLPSLRQHDLRVTFSSSLQAEGVALTVAQRLLEHSDPKLTANTYTGVDHVLVEAVNRLPVGDWIP